MLSCNDCRVPIMSARRYMRSATILRSNASIWPRNSASDLVAIADTFELTPCRLETEISSAILHDQDQRHGADGENERDDEQGSEKTQPLLRDPCHQSEDQENPRGDHQN